MDCSGVRFSRHAVERVFQRGIAPETVEHIVKEGEVIASYADDTPYPSALVLGFDKGRPVHVVAARDADTGICYIVTVYRPEPDAWSGDYKTRRQR